MLYRTLKRMIERGRPGGENRHFLRCGQGDRERVPGAYRNAAYRGITQTGGS